MLVGLAMLSFCMPWAGTGVTPRGSLVVLQAYMLCVQGVCVAGIHVQVRWLWVWCWIKLPGFYQICCERLLAAGSMHATLCYYATATMLLPLCYAIMPTVLLPTISSIPTMLLLVYAVWYGLPGRSTSSTVVWYWLVMVFVGALSACHNLTP